MADDGEERTEDPTEARRREAATRGQTWKSAELQLAFGLLGATVVLGGLGPAVATFLLDTMGDGLASIGDGAGDPVRSVTLISDLVQKTVGQVVMLVAAIGGISLAAAAAQAKGIVSWEALAPKFEKLDPVAGFRRLLPSAQTGVELLKQGIKLLVLSLAAWVVLREAIPAAAQLVAQDPRSSAIAAAGWLRQLLAIAGASFLALGVADLLWQRRVFERSLRMTKYEVKQESKNQEGNPMVRLRQRTLGRQRVRAAMLRKVPTATVVIVNPTHIAIALRYDPEVAPAPVVVALGQRKVAERIKKLALASGVPVVENRPLARALIKVGQVGMMIPAELYTAVAEVLAFVFRQRGEGAARRDPGAA